MTAESNSQLINITESQIGLILFLVSLLYCLMIVIFDSIQNKKFVLSKNLLRHLVDGLTLATGVTVAIAIVVPEVFKLVAANSVYVTVTSLTCIFGPVLNFAERYGRIIEK